MHTIEQVLAWVFPLGGACLLLHGLWGLRRWIVARSWPTAPGEITRCVFVKDDSDPEAYAERLDLRYTYTVDGVTYVNHRVSAGGDLSVTVGGRNAGWSTPRAARNRYPVGRAVQVRYNPHRPAESCLETGGLLCVIVELAAGALLLAYGAALAAILVSGLAESDLAGWISR